MTPAVHTMIAWDVDGVFNHFSKTAKRKSLSGMVDVYPVSWRPELLESLKERMVYPGVTNVWLSTWLQQPQHLTALEELLGLDELNILRADYPHRLPLAWGGSTLANPRFEGADLRPGNSSWWKYRAAEMLLEQHSPKRFAWVDDDLGTNTGRLDPWHPKLVTYERLLLKTNPSAGMLPEHLAKLDSWLAMESPA